MNGKPWNVPATPAEVEHLNDTTEQETSKQHWKDELSILRHRLVALEGANPDSSACMSSSHNPATFASSASSHSFGIFSINPRSKKIYVYNYIDFMDHKMGQPSSYLIMQIQSMIDEDAIHLSHIFLFNTFFIWYFYRDCCHYSLTFRFHPMDLYFWGIFSYDIKCFSIGWMSNYSYYLWFFFTYHNAWIRYSYL